MFKSGRLTLILMMLIVSLSLPPLSAQTSRRSPAVTAAATATPAPAPTSAQATPAPAQAAPSAPGVEAPLEIRADAEIRLEQPALERMDFRGEARLEPAGMPRAGQTVRYVVRLSWLTGMADVEVDEPKMPDAFNLAARKITSSLKESASEGRTIAEFAIQLKCRQKGQAYIGNVEGKFRLKDNSGEGSFRIRGQRFEIAESRFRWGRIFTWIGIILGILAVAAGLVRLVIWFVKRPPKVRVTTPQPEDTDATTPYERILGELSSMKIFLMEGEARDVYTKIAKLARGFVSVSEGPEVTRLTTDEMLRLLKDRNYNPENRDRIFSILERCDRVKSAGYVPTQNETEQIIKDFESLIRAQFSR